MMTDEKTIVLVKKKNIQLMLDYCLEKKLEFTVRPRNISDEWEVGPNIDSIKKAIALGIFVRDNKLEVPGLGDLATLATPPAPKAAAKNPAKAEPARTELNTPQQQEEEESAPVNTASLAEEKPREEAFSLQF